MLKDVWPEVLMMLTMFIGFLMVLYFLVFKLPVML